MNAQLKPREFPLPSSLKVIPGTEKAQAAYPYHIQFSKADDQKFWFYNSMHFPEPMSAFDMVTAEAAYCALGAANTRVHCLPTTLGIDHRIINGRVYIGGNAVTDPAEIARSTPPPPSPCRMLTWARGSAWSCRTRSADRPRLRTACNTDTRPVHVRSQAPLSKSWATGIASASQACPSSYFRARRELTFAAREHEAANPGAQ